MGKSESLSLKIMYADNGVIIYDGGTLELKVIPFGEKEDKTEIYKKIGEAIYEEWRMMEEELSVFTAGVEIKVSFKPIEKDVIRV